MLNRFLFTTSLVILGFMSLSAQKIGFGAGLGFARLTGVLGEQGGFGLVYGLEGKYYLNSKIAVGAEYNSAVLVYKEESNFVDVGAYGNTQYLLKGEYYLLTKKFRPYAGLGLGFSQIATPEITISSGTSTTTIPSEKKGNFGIVPRLGFMIGGFGFEFDYNLNGRTPKSVDQNVSSADKPFNYYTVKLKYVYELEF